jgi:hypothetical protein
MTVTVKCDLCKADIPEGADSFSIEVSKHWTNHNCYGVQNTMSEWANIDLCEKCAGKLREWVGFKDDVTKWSSQ